MAKETGEIVLPLSVEGANSLLVSVGMMDGSKLHGTFAARAIVMFQRFLRWLRARKIEFHAFDISCTGWHSEHINEPGTIHIWDTSQVVEFLIHFRKLLQRHIARESLILSRVKVDEIKDEPDWAKVIKEWETVTNHNIIDRPVLTEVYDDFIAPWRAKSDSKNFSMLVYGPPGTGKTTLASNLSNSLGFRLITVTVSDFLGAGGALVEARAKAIFQMLEAQGSSVIFFDEIDSFLLDRDSSHYRDQDTLFKFLTPGMLTKFNDLRRARRSIFIIATNYANRIDPAIKRVGRIDRRYLLLPPDLATRRKVFTDKMSNFGDAEIAQFSKASVFLGSRQIEDIIGRLPRDGSAADAIVVLKRAPKPSTPEQYLARINGETTFPDDEFIAMVKIAKEADYLGELRNALSAADAAGTQQWKKFQERNPTFRALVGMP